jgi:hypothetical protein
LRVSIIILGVILFSLYIRRSCTYQV